MSFYVTTPIYYVNAAPHLGHAYTTIAVDAIARHHRQRGEDVFFLTGTDEHGEPVADAAHALGLEPQALADKNAERFKALLPQIGASNDFFIRTTDPRHMAKVQEVLARVRENGFVYKGTYEGSYCPRCADFKAENEIDAGNRCPIHHIELTREQEENYFFRLSAFQEPLERLYAEREDFVAPRTRYNEALSFLRSGLRDVPLSRHKLTWGVPVPWDEEHVFYVWFDALLNYYSALSYAPAPSANPVTGGGLGSGVEGGGLGSGVTGGGLGSGVEGGGLGSGVEGEGLGSGVEGEGLGAKVEGEGLTEDLTSEFWPANYHVIAKDILRFHAIYWPALLMAAELELPQRIFVHGYLLMDGEKMSKSLGNVLDPFAVIERFGADALRFYLLRDVPFGQDGSVSTAAFEQRYASELANDLGNLASRTLAMIVRYRDGVLPAGAPDPVPAPDPALAPDLVPALDPVLAPDPVPALDPVLAPDPVLVPDFDGLSARVSELIDRAELTLALEEIWERVRRLNRYVEEQAPWQLAKDASRATELDRVLTTLAEGLRVVAVLLWPYLPASSERLLAALGAPDLSLAGATLGAGRIERVVKIESLFPKES